MEYSTVQGATESQNVPRPPGLSDKACVELVRLLQAKELLSSVVHSRKVTGGKQSEWFVTKEHLIVEIEEAMKDRGGRIGLSELPTLLGVGSTLSDEAATTLCETDRSYFLAQSELFHESYFVNLLEEIGDRLQETGVLALAEVAQSKCVTLDLLVNKVMVSSGPSTLEMLPTSLTRVRGLFDQESLLLYTDAHVDSVRANVAGALRHSTQPVKLDQLQAAAELPAGLFSRVLEEAIDANNLRGSIPVGSNTWVPTEYVDAQRRRVDAFWASSGFVTKEIAKRHGIMERDWKSFANSVGTDAVDLGGVLVSAQLVETTAAMVGEALEDTGVGFCDLRDHAPAEFSCVEVSAFAELLTSEHGKRSWHAMCDVYIVSSTMVERLSRSVANTAAGAAKTHVPCVSTSEKTRRSEFPPENQRKKGKKKGRRRAANERENGASSRASIIITDIFVLQCVLQERPDLATYEDLASALSIQMKRPALEAFAKAEAEIVAGAAHAAAMHLQDAIYWLELFASGNRAVFLSDTSTGPCELYDSHLIRTTGQQVLEALSQVSPDTSLRKENFTTVIELINALRDESERVGVRLKALDEEKEDSLTTAHAKMLTDKLMTATDAPSLLASAIPLLILKHRRACVNIPGKALSPAIPLLAQHMDPDDVTFLKEFFDRVIKELTSDHGAGTIAREGDGMVERLKSLVTCN